VAVLWWATPHPALSYIDFDFDFSSHPASQTGLGVKVPVSFEEKAEN